MQSLSRKKFSSETMKKVNWVHRMYYNWRAYINNSPHLENIECDIEDINSLTRYDLKQAVCKFITEVKRLDGEDYPARTMYDYDIVICLQFWLESNGVLWKLISDEDFSDVKFTLDNIMKRRYEDGVGQKVRKADIVDLSEEEVLWSLGLLGTHNPEVLLNTLVYLIGLHCALWAGKEHRVLRSLPLNSQFVHLRDSEGQLFI